ncbi:MAG: helix-turn-helix domain-containing protein [Kiritimatiellae bacterium]|nr:helix-turn-helix domain-containing protein [Kiritimatiellia bacterium]
MRLRRQGRRVRRRLRSGETVADIVKAMHFASANQLYQMYKRHFGLTIRQTVRRPQRD